MFYVRNTNTEPVPTDPEESGSDSDGLDNTEGTHPDFISYAPSPHMYNVDINAEGGLEFPKLLTKEQAMQVLR
ncbi:hypothetical protein J1N35_025138 [Gossypium stocksii]|uniref:Uncharacterized protein n=1 Tax=Gossypium stocksii TaxID=47602 RepID=A0A9D3ZVX3_9ROSI|nr:hypothetical protein J1N35_025138 [Gossypium stocksii]